MNKIERCPFVTCTFAQWQTLRQIVFGQCPCLVRSEFFSRGPGMVFREAEQQLAYGLTFIGGDMTPLARSVLMIVQAQVLRTLLFETDPNKTLKSRYIIWYNLVVDRYIVTALYGVTNSMPFTLGMLCVNIWNKLLQISSSCYRIG